MATTKYGRPFTKYATLNDDGSTINANANHATAADYIIAPTAGEVWEVTRLLVNIGDTSGVSADEYGNLGAVLNPGIHILMEQNGTEYYITDPNVPVTTNGEWAEYCYDVTLFDWDNTPTNEYVGVRWTFSRMGAPVRLVGDDEDKLIVRLGATNYTGLVHHHFVFQGIDTSTTD